MAEREPLTKNLHELLVEAAADEGFPLAGAVDIDPALSEFDRHVQRYDEWLKAGYSGTMSYLGRGRNRRANPRLVFPEAKSVFCVAIPYSRKPAGVDDPGVGVRYARYIQGRDYHVEIAERLERVMQKVRDARSGCQAPSLEWKICVDTSAVLERSWAALAGLGWIGKNTLLIHPKLGSFLFLAVILLNEETGQVPRPLRSYCGHCTRCLDACPTRAFAKPGVLDATRCISYATLEKKKAFPLDEEQRRKVGTWVAGCDICQEVCPFNRKPAMADDSCPEPLLSDWESLLSETEQHYHKRISDSALSRVKPSQFSRNLAVALLNAFEQLPSREKIAFTKRYLAQVRSRYESEQDDFARIEWKRCYDSLAGLD